MKREKIVAKYRVFVVKSWQFVVSAMILSFSILASICTNRIEHCVQLIEDTAELIIDDKVL